MYIDPHRSVPKAIVTHAHSDHARKGHKSYLAESSNKEVLKHRLGHSINLQTLKFGDKLNLNGVSVSFHPSGHIWGSAQVRTEYQGEVWCFGGDYKLEYDFFSHEFEPIVCNTFVSESTFALPVFRWKKQQQVFEEINDWWVQNNSINRRSLLLAYSLGKAQRLLKNIDHGIGPVYVHDSIFQVNRALIKDGAQLPTFLKLPERLDHKFPKNALIISPSETLKSEEGISIESANVSGWVNLKSLRKKRTARRNFVLSDHADWDGLNEAVNLSKAQTVITTHGYKHQFAKWLQSRGLNSQAV